MEPTPWDPEGVDPLLDPQGRISDPGATKAMDLKEVYKQLIAARSLDLRLSRASLPAYASFAGEESVAVAAVAAVEGADWIFPGQRDAAVAFLRGMEPDEVARQILGQSDAETAGSGPAGQLSSAALRVAPVPSSLGLQLPLAAGMALGQKHAGQGHVSLVIFGEGTTTTGSFHESVAAAAAADLPLVMLCKSQLWPEGAPAEAGLLGDSVSERVAACGLWSRRVDGADPVQVIAAVKAAVGRARDGKGPGLVDIVVTHLQHGPPAHRDPLERLRRHLDQAGVWTQTFQDVAEAEHRGRLEKGFRAVGGDA